MPLLHLHILYVMSLTRLYQPQSRWSLAHIIYLLICIRNRRKFLDAGFLFHFVEISLGMDFFIHGQNCYIWPIHMRPIKYISSSKVEMGLYLIGHHVNISLPCCCSWCSLKRFLCVLACGHTRKLESWWRDKHFIVSLICLINLRVLGLVFAHHLAPLRPPSKATM